MGGFGDHRAVSEQPEFAPADPMVRRNAPAPRTPQAAARGR